VLNRLPVRRRVTLPAGVRAALQQGRKSYSLRLAGGEGPLVASYNVHKCVGTDQRFDPERTAMVIAEMQADVVALQEATKRFGERTNLLDLAWLERRCGLASVPLNGGASRRCGGWHGNLLLLREGAVREVRHIALPGVEPRGALVVDVDLRGGPLRVVAAHLGLLRRSREQQAAALLAAVERAEDRPTVLLGDLNEWRVGPRSSLLPLKPAFGPLSAALPSFPSRFPLFALDRILSSPHSLITSLEVHDTALARAASDHLPIKARIDLAAAAGAASGELIAA
jgi:endonuclease/exonuclease/phosphatase family metal-dependent hydrolase